jgi:hypothetical protein
MTREGIAALAPNFIATILATVASFSAFDAGNDPYGEHDCTVLTVDRRSLLPFCVSLGAITDVARRNECASTTVSGFRWTEPFLPRGRFLVAWERRK